MSDQPARPNHDQRGNVPTNPRKIAQRFLKCILQQVGGLAGSALDDEEDDEQMPEIPSAATAKNAFSSGRKTVNQHGYGAD